MNPQRLTRDYTNGIMSGRDVIVVSIQPWYYELGSNCKNIATQFSKHNRVLYVNIPITRRTYWSKQKSPGIAEHCNIIREKGTQIRKIKANMWEFFPTTLIESINSLPSTTLFRLINRINNGRFARDIQKAIKELDFKDYIVFNDNDIYNGFHLKELLNPSLYIYYCRDFLQGNPYWKRHCKVLEPLLIKKADLVAANSTYYEEYCSQFNPESYYMGQGCLLDSFDKQKPHPLPKELTTIKRPVIGYVGAVDSSRLDIAVVRIIAKHNPEWRIVLVGPEDENFTKSDLHQLSNIIFTGRRPFEQLSDYIEHFDICMNPQLLNPLTIGNYPLKVDEYLSMGKPVVATETKAMELFSGHTYLAKKADEYPALIEKALIENSPEKEKERITFAKSHTWENCMLELYKAMAKHQPPLQ